MAPMFVPNQNVDAAIAAEAPGLVFTSGTELCLSQSGSLYCLWLCILSLGQENRWITGHGFDNIISFTDIIPYKVQGIGKIIMAATTANLKRNQPYRRLNNMKALVQWCRC